MSQKQTPDQCPSESDGKSKMESLTQASQEQSTSEAAPSDRSQTKKQSPIGGACGKWYHDA